MATAPGTLKQHGSRVLDWKRNYYVRDTDSPPLISERTSFVCAGLFTLIYVAPFYLSSTLRANSITSRDAPSVIRARVRAVGFTCLACTVIAVYFLHVHGSAPPVEIVRLLGIWPVKLIDILKVLALVMVLFSCSLYETIIVDGEWRHWSPSALKEGIWDSWTGYRNLVVAPISEEVVFRALTIPLFLLARMSPVRIVFVTPLVFGLAHLHHLFAFLKSHTPSNQRFPPFGVWIRGILVSAFQFAYTSLFGFFAAFVFLRTGSIYTAIAAHTFCNKMGVPRLWGRVGPQEHHLPLRPIKADAAHGKRVEDELNPGSPVKVGNSLMQDEYDESKAALEISQSLSITWSVVYYVLMFVGSYGFYLLLFPLTESDNALAVF